jgi:hypothetical protein
MDPGRVFDDITSHSALLRVMKSKRLLCTGSEHQVLTFLAAPEASTSNLQILASSYSTSVPVLSPEAVRVLDGLPDLSFMQAKLLMFPVRGTSP